MYEVGTAAGVRAFHVMPGMQGPEGELHAHDYRIELTVSREELTSDGWVCDLDVLGRALADLTAGLEGADLEQIRPPGAEAVTVEIFARWVHDVVAAEIDAGGAEELAVRVWESPVSFGGFAGPVTGSHR